MDLELRVATEEDIPALNALIPTSVRGLSQGYYTPAQIESALVHHIFGVDTQLITDGTYFVVEHNRQLVGAGGWSKRRTLYGGDQLKSEADPLLDPAHDAAHIRAYFIHPDWARQGIGGRIMHTCEAAARAAGFSRLDLGSTVQGEAFYRAMGYEVSERLEIAMPDGTALPYAEMTKTLE
jgi:N-acetylglutamate synthase-like GNAT family acetyltransferase